MSDRPEMELAPEARRVFDEYLRTMSFRSQVYYRGQVCDQWFLDTSGTSHVNVHVVCHGHCWFRVPGLETPQRLNAGDVVVLPHDAAHLLLSTPDVPAHYGAISMPHQGPHDRNAPGTALFCGYLIVDQNAYRHVFAMLPDHVIIRSGHDTDAAGFRALIDLLFAETQASGLGASAILDRLADAMMFYVIRHALRQRAHAVGLWPLLADKHLRAAVVAMCDTPAEPWTVAALAAKAFLSRSTFAERFHALCGKTPMAFLTDWRMQLACRWLTHERLSVAEVAVRCGYQTEAAFAKVFKRSVGVGPGEFRRARQVSPEPESPDATPPRRARYRG